MEPAIVAIIILVVTMILFITEALPIPVTAVCAALAMGIFGVVDYSTAFSGFSNDVTIMVIGAMIVGEALFETGVANKIGEIIIRRVGNNEKAFLFVCVFITAVVSAFISDTAVVAMMLPVIAATAARSGGKIQKKNVCMAVGFASNIGGGMTLVGSTPNVICQGLLVEAGLETMGFFDLTLGSLPRLAFVLLFYLTIGYRLQKKVFDFDDSAYMVPETTSESEDGKKTYSKSKMIISVSMMVLMVIGFVSGIWTFGTIALTAGVLCVVTRCISIKDVFKRLDWNTVWVLSGSLGMAAGIDESGAGALIANTVIGWFGGSLSYFTLLIILTVISVIMANIMSSSASSAILGPIAISICVSMGFNPVPAMLAIIWSLNLAFLTPVATPPITMTLQAGYRFLDYTKLGAPLMVGCLVMTIIMYPFII